MNDQHPHDFVSALFGAAKEIMREINEAAKKEREERRIKRNVAARRRYQMNKGKPKPEKKPETHEHYVSEGCTCFLGHPPCSYCENGQGFED